MSRSHRDGLVGWPRKTTLTVVFTKKNQLRHPLAANALSASLRPRTPHGNRSIALRTSLSHHPRHLYLPPRPALHAQRVALNTRPVHLTPTLITLLQLQRADFSPPWRPKACSPHLRRRPANAPLKPRSPYAQLHACYSRTARPLWKITCPLHARPTGV